MQGQANENKHIWLLSGTGDGPPIVEALIRDGWKVTVSVVTSQAALQYSDLSVEDMWVGALDGVQGILDVLNEFQTHNQGFAWVVDATHPFAELISNNLRRACKKIGQPLVRFERPLEGLSTGLLINSFRDLASKNLKDKRLLFAIGARYLQEAVVEARKGGASVYARVLPYAESLKEALATEIEPDHLAIMRPLCGTLSGYLETALCRRWSVDFVVCRQSGGPTQRLWERICKEERIELIMLARPPKLVDIEYVNTCKDLLEILASLKENINT